jgi:flagellar hook-length control protein FliK
MESTAPTQAINSSKKDMQTSGENGADKPIAQQTFQQTIQQNVTTGTNPIAPKPPGKPAQSDRAEKSNKRQDSTTANSGSSSTNNVQISIANLPIADNPALALAPQPLQPTKTVQAANDDNDDMEIPGAAPVPAAAKPPAALSPDDDRIQDAGSQAATKADTNTAAPQNNVAAPAAATTDTRLAALQNVAATPAANVTTAMAQSAARAHPYDRQAEDTGTQLSANIQTAPQADTKPDSANGDTATSATALAQSPAAVLPIDQAEDFQAGAPTSAQAPNRTNGKPAPPKDHTPASTTASTQSSTAASGIDQAENTQAGAPAFAERTGDVSSSPLRAETNGSIDTFASKPVLQPVQAANDTAIGVTAPQAPQPASAPLITQNVQVTAQPSPNLPALAVEIAAKSQSGARQFDIRLDPPELGRVDVRLSIDATGKTSAHLSADQPQTLNLLQKDAPTLTRALRDAGLDVSQDGLNFSLRQQANQDGSAGQNSGRGTSRNFSITATATIDATTTSAAYHGIADGRLDIRV